MQKRLLWTFLGMIMATLLLTVMVSWRQVDRHFIERVHQDAKTQVILIQDILVAYNQYDDDFLEGFVSDIAAKTGTRLTIVSQTGLVLADSHGDKAIMDNHLAREEIRRALEGDALYPVVRFSDTTKTYMSYVAMPVKTNDFNGFIRVAVPIHEIEGLVSDALRIVLIGFVIGGIVAFGIAYWFSLKWMAPIDTLTQAARRIANGEYEEKIYIEQKDQLGHLAEAFNTMAFNLRLHTWEIEQRNSELESIINSMSNGVIVVNRDYQITLFNQKFIELFRIEDQNLIGKTFYEITRHVAIFEVLENAYEEQQLVVKEVKMPVSQSEHIYMLYGTPIMSKKSPDVILGTLLMVQDVTAIRKLENLRSDFVSNVTHELKTPLTSIRGFVDTLKQGAIHEPVAFKFLDIIEIEAERLEILINDVLVLSEIESLMGDRDQKRYDLKLIVEEVMTLLAPMAEEKGIELIQLCEEGIEPYLCNTSRIKQLMINLIDNAIKYTEKGQVTLRLYDHYSNVVLEVSDTGIGIEASHIPRLFERFYRVDKGRSRNMGGTGLGLSIVKHIIELYNGRITVTSEPKVGTKMTVYLPKG